MTHVRAPRFSGGLAGLSPLETGDRIPYRLVNGLPTYLEVVEVTAEGEYRVSYPDGHIETLRDSD